MKKELSIFAACGLLASCGFQPMYATQPVFPQGQEQADVQAAMTQIEISNIPDRSGQYLRNALIDRFYRDGRPQSARYTLNIGNIEESIIDLDITKNSDATRGQLRLDSELTLIDNQTQQTVLERDLRSITSYNILTSEFATRVSEDNTRQNALDDLARQVELHLSIFLQGK